MFLAALSLTLAALSPIVPASSPSPGAVVAVCFSPEENCAAFADRAIGNAEREILVGAYGLIRAKQRGIDIRLIADKTTPCERNSAVETLAAAGVQIWIDDRARIAHAKTMVIDGAVTLTGSYNWTRGTAANSENLNLISSPAVAAAYTAHWRQRLAVSVRFNGKDNWCRVATTDAR